MTEVQAVRAALGNMLSLTCPVQEEPCECCVFERAVVAEGLAACDGIPEDYVHASHIKAETRVEVIASILRRAGLLQ